MPLYIKEIEADELTPVRVFKQLTGKNKALLESSLKFGLNGRYSFISQNPVDKITLTEGNTAYNGQPSTALFLDEVEKRMSENVVNDHRFPFIGGALGYVGYETIHQYENIGEYLPDPLDLPEAQLYLYKEMVVFDHIDQTVFITSIESQEKVDALATELQKESQLSKGEVQVTAFTSAIGQSAFEEMVETAQAAIRQGEIFQVVPSQRMSANYTGDTFEIYRRLKRRNPSPYLYYLEMDGCTIIGSSPESVVAVHGQTITMKPIAGTRRRGATPAEDDILAAELMADEKEVAEHTMLVDLARNDVGRRAENGTVEVTKLMTVEKYSDVMHIVSEVSAILKQGHTAFDALRAGLPAGTVSGAPKIAAMRLINQMEQVKRGIYSGGVGYFSFNGDMDFALAIRTMVVEEETLHVQAGAGVVLDSVPAKEYEETLNKAKALMEVARYDSFNR
ncbi:anthranilate synthase component I [Brochothrix thermosphacta]|uniref:anthranilate synthase component I n=1 Tax=Brochothrix thermosphacta TaxID=2756 RepID=UPI00265CA3A2|nr:anthranilate synthase component I [Brochothrix thermosphacta]WKK68072.1 anthranilate synthase component I [Brochothrix thermosphacta]